MTLYDELSAARRVVLHGKVAGAIEAIHRNRLDDHLPALAHHYARAAAPAAETDKAIEYATRAGDRALAQLAHDEAVTYYHQALELLDGPRARRRKAAASSCSSPWVRHNAELAIADRRYPPVAAAWRRASVISVRLARAALANYRGITAAPARRGRRTGGGS